MTGEAAIRIRSMTAADAPAVARLASAMAHSLADPDPKLDPRQLVANGFTDDPWFEALVAEHDGAVIGFVMACRRYEAHMARRSLWIADLYVADEARRLGAGRALMDAIAMRAAQLGCERLAWDLWTKNTKARAFYEALGATIDEELWVMAAKVCSGKDRCS
jgi:GNAT superfamily N-acetyltransferase